MICQHDKYKNILEKNGYVLSECSYCQIISVYNKENKLLSAREIYDDYYQKGNAGRFGVAIEAIVKMFRLVRSFKIFFLKTSAKSILDIGSGRGWMLYFLKKYFRFETTVGTQISENAYKFSLEKLKLEIYNKDLLELPLDRKFDVITLWHVLEHVENPEKYVARIYELLNIDGRLFIESPNFNSWSYLLTKKYWLALDLKHHLYFFTPASLINLLKKYNFKIKQVRTFSWEYSTFTSTQSLVNILTNSDSYFFTWLQNRKFNFKIIWHTILFAILFWPCFLVNLGLYFSRWGEVVAIIAQKNDKR